VSDPPGRVCCWSSKASSLLQSVAIAPERLPPFKYSLDALGHFLSSKQDLNQEIKEDIYKQYIQDSRSAPSEGFGLKMAFYSK
jgi:hypothetical protein